MPGDKGKRVIVETEAEIVRRIFREYVDGRTPRDIACDLNKENVPPPRGRAWSPSTINGNMQRGTGVLQNELYAGRLVWNKVRMIKDPDTGKQISRPNPKSQKVNGSHQRFPIWPSFLARCSMPRGLARKRGLLAIRTNSADPGMFCLASYAAELVAPGCQQTAKTNRAALRTAFDVRQPTKAELVSIRRPSTSIPSSEQCFPASKRRCATLR